MVFHRIEQAKSDYTDRYVAVVGDRPEHARFVGLVGQVKTVNMSGRALVEWLNYAENIGWYDIDLEYLKVVEKPPEPEVSKPKTAAKPAAAKKAAGLSPLELLRQQSATKKTASPPAAKAKTEAMSPLELLRKQGGAKTSREEEKAEPQAPALSPLEQLRQQGGTKRKPAPASDAPAEPEEPKAKLSPLEILRQQGGTKKRND